jgi:hypothetical protein
MLNPFGRNHAMNRRAGVPAAAAFARRDHNADGKKGNARLTPTLAPPRTRRREIWVGLVDIDFSRFE